MSYELFIAGRYLKSKRKTGFISLITYISIAGIVIGVAALIIVLSVMNGFEDQVRSRFLGADAHIHVQTLNDKGIKQFGALSDQIQGIHHVVHTAPFIEEKALIKSKASQNGILVRGIDPIQADSVLDIRKSIIYGQMDFKNAPVSQGELRPGVIIGFELSKRLQVVVGDEISLISLAGYRKYGDIPRIRTFRVAGYFETGLFEFDDRVVYISLESAQDLFERGDRVDGLWVKADRYEHADKVAARIQDKIGYPYQVVSWREMNPNLFAWMQIEKWAAFIVLCLIILVAAFNIVSTLIMTTLEKTRDIGILKTMGASNPDIRRIFTYQGAIVGIAGTLIGMIIGLAFCWAQLEYKFFALPEDVYIISWLPISIRWPDILVIGLASIILTFLASVYPAGKAAKRNPVEAIRYE
jgi:lipoprotein-releasing system permease protein